MPGEKKLTSHLLNLLETINSLTQPTASDEWEDYFILWMKVRYLSQSLERNIDTPPNMLQLTKKLQGKFSKQILPRLTTFTQQLKKQQITSNLSHVFTKLQEYISEAKQYLMSLPMESYEIYQNALYFLNLYRFAFPDPVIYKKSKRVVEMHISTLNQAFRREAGSADLQETQNSLDNQLRSSLKGKSPNTPTPENVISNEVSKDVMTSTDNKQIDLMSGVVEFPEESTQSSSLDSESKSIVDDAAVLNNLTEIDQLNQTPVESNVSVYRYGNWYPFKNISLYKSILYCDHCGRLVSFQTESCMGCSQNFHSVIHKQQMA